MIKRRNKIIVAILFLFLVLFPLGATTYAAVNNTYNNGEVIENDLDGKMKNSVILDALAAMVYGLASWIESLVGWSFEMLTGANMFPWADRVIFNTVAFLDVNFLNPAPGSLFLTSEEKGKEETDLAGIVQSVYSTVFTLAVTFLGVVVGLMAIKLAISSLASEKAKYKEALMKFLFSLVMLFAMHYAMSFIFYINESMVEMASGILTKNLGEVEIDLDLNISNDIIVQNFIKQNGAGEPVPQAIFNMLMPGVSDFLLSAALSSSSEKMDEILLDETIVEQYVDKEGVSHGTSNKALAGQLLSDSTYRKHRIPDAYGNNTGNVKLSDFVRWIDPNNMIELSAKSSVVMDVTLLQNKNDYNAFKKCYDDFKSIGFEKFKIVDEKFANDEDKEAFKNTIYYKNIIENKHMFDNFGDSVEEGWVGFVNGWNSFFGTGAEEIDLDNEKAYRIAKSAQLLMDQYYEPLIRAHEIYVENLKDSTKPTPETLIRNLGQYFKESAWTYETNDKDEVVGWTPSKVTLTGAILYGMFIIQSIMFFFAYIKRFFYVIILAMLAPIIVIYDFLGKVAS